MPTYEYACSACDTTHEVQQKMTDSSLTDCPACGQSGLRKLFSGVGIHFKGSGFYRTDSRDSKSSASAGSSAGSSNGASTDSGKSATPASGTSTGTGSSPAAPSTSTGAGGTSSSAGSKTSSSTAAAS